MHSVLTNSIYPINENNHNYFIKDLYFSDFDCSCSCIPFILLNLRLAQCVCCFFFFMHHFDLLQTNRIYWLRKERKKQKSNRNMFSPTCLFLEFIETGSFHIVVSISNKYEFFISIPFPFRFYWIYIHSNFLLIWIESKATIELHQLTFLPFLNHFT